MHTYLSQLLYHKSTVQSQLPFFAAYIYNITTKLATYVYMYVCTLCIMIIQQSSFSDWTISLTSSGVST